MLDEYVTELKKKLTERKDTSTRMAVYEGGDIHRGMAQALEAALLDVDEVLEQFREPEEVPGHLKKAAVLERGYRVTRDGRRA